MSGTVYITHSAVCLPNAAVDNDSMEAVLGQCGARSSRARRVILRSNGIKTRYYAIDPANGQATHSNASLTAEAIRGLHDEEFSLNAIETLCCGTSIADQLMPGHAVMVHGELRNPPCEVYSAAGVCVAGMAAMKYAWYAVRSGESQCAVSSGSELSSSFMRGTRFHDELTQEAERLSREPELAFNKDFLRWMLSDGAGALVLKPRARVHGLSLRIEWIFERSYADTQPACMYAGAEKEEDGTLRGWTSFPNAALTSRSVMAIKQDVKQLNANIVPVTLAQPLQEVIAKYDLQADDIDWFLPHYSSNYFRQPVFDAMQALNFEIPFERWFTNLSHCGNTGSASIYIMLDELLRGGQLRVGQKILCYVPESGRFSAAFTLMTVCDASG